MLAALGVADEQAAPDELGDARLVQAVGVRPAGRLDAREQLEVVVAERIGLPAQHRERDGLRGHAQADVAAQERRQIECRRVGEGEEEAPGPADPRRHHDPRRPPPRRNHGNGNHGKSGRKIQGNQGKSV